MKKRAYQRRQIITNAPFQWRYAASVLYTMLFTVAVTAFTVTWFFLFHTSLGVEAQSNGALIKTILVVCSLFSLAILYRTFRFTHTIAGPIHKVTLLLRKAAAGDIPAHPVRFRRGDSFNELADALTALFQRMNSLQQQEHEPSEAVSTSSRTQEPTQAN